MERLKKLRELLQENPKDSFVRYGLAMEYARQGRWEEAIGEFRILIAADPDYVAAYFHAGQTLEKLGRSDEARTIYHEGVEAAVRRGDSHARSELEAALGFLD
ncbi:MAG TPA: tetratricopeptide repeat protein [Terriglobia bacterium]|nr:tetratricopeptide repeat protein [Terriglobia bacterium]